MNPGAQLIDEHGSPRETLALFRGPCADAVQFKRDTGQHLAEIVVKLARQAPALFFLHGDQAPRQPQAPGLRNVTLACVDISPHRPFSSLAAV
ncbi:hypothetical protein MesoLj131a_06540 [Mesorhizobium sp. 131-2-1]|nr:hypothetical protein MesoLj131a_06540 [Mesorhizobium sp. 131-2-1]